MQQRAGLLFLAKTTSRILLILEDQKWTVPTFERSKNLLDDAQQLILNYSGSNSKLLPIELYQSADKGFEYGTYVCLVETEFLPTCIPTFSWCQLKHLPKQLHAGLKYTLSNPLTTTKIDTIIRLENANSYAS